MGKKRVGTVYLAAPVGGINAVAPASNLPQSDCVYAYNLIPTQLGPGSRLGSQEWVTGMTGGIDNSVRTHIGYQGSAANGNQDKQWSITAKGIWDCTSSSSSPSLVLAFGSQAGDAGYGSAVVISIPAGKFVIYCDAVNGAFIYTESTGTWAQYAGATEAPWVGLTPVNVGDRVVNVGNEYTCVTQGVTGNSSTGGPTSVAPGAINDGSAVWNYVGAQVPKALGPSLADQQAVYGDNYAAGVTLFQRLAAVTSWKNRVWFTEINSNRAWYLPIGNVFGVLTSFDFGARFIHGGQLMNLFNWSYDGGSGLDTLLTAISSSGDIAIYQGTDPASLATFGLKGTWFAGAVPYGRRIAVEFGGEVLILSKQGVLPLSKLVTGSSIFDRGQYSTQKIFPLFQPLVSLFGGLQGWAINIHPADNALIITVPQPPGYAPIQFAMSFATKGWFQYRGLPMQCMGIWKGDFYFGTPDGRLVKSTGYVDNVTLANPNNYTPVAWSILPRFDNGGRMSLKQAKMCKISLLTAVPNPIIQAVAKYDYDTIEPADTSSSGAGGANSWDVAQWDVAKWQPDQTPVTKIQGLAGMGRAVSVALRGQAISRTILIGQDVMFEEAGDL